MNIGPSVDAGLVSTAQLLNPGAAIVGYTPPGTGAVATTVAVALNNIQIQSISALRLVAKGTSSSVYVMGYYAPGDGGGGFYTFVSTDVTSPDNGGSIIVASDGGRWYLNWTGFVSAKQFGAKGDGVTNDVAAINAALVVGNTKLPGVASTSSYFISSAILMPSNRRLFGDGYLSQIVPNSSFTTLSPTWFNTTIQICITNSNVATGGANSFLEVDNLYINMANNAGNQGILFYNCDHHKIHHCWGNAGQDFIANPACTYYEVHDNIGIGTTNACYDQWDGASNGIIANNIAFPANGYGILITGVSSLGVAKTTQHIAAIGNTLVGGASGQIGIWFQGGGTASAATIRCRAENNHISGFVIGIRSTSGGKNIISNNVLFSCQVGIQTTVEIANNLSNNNIIANNLLDTCGNGGANNRAISLSGPSSNNIVESNRVINVAGDYAIFTDTNCNNNLILNNNLDSGATAAIFTGSVTGNQVRGNFGYSPAVQTGVTAGASPFTFTLLVYDATYTITTVGGMTALTLDGVNVQITVNTQIFVKALHTLVATWATTAPVFSIVPQQ